MADKLKKYDVVSVGGATVDILFYSKEGELISTGNIAKQKLLAFEYGDKILAERIFYAYGGGAANSAVTFSRLGLKTAPIFRLGADDNGRKVLANLRDNKVDASWVKTDAKASTAFSVVITVDNEAKEHIAFIHRGANALLSADDLPLGKIEAKWFYVTSLPKFGWEDIMAKLAKTKKNIVWNPGKEQIGQMAKLKKHLPGIKMFMVNRDEALEFKKLKDIKGLLRHIKDLGPELVVITDGKNGAYAFDGKKYYFMRALSTKAVNTLGVGDAFGSALTAALVYGKNIRQALAWGMKNSAAVVCQIGAQKGILTKKQINKK